MTCETSMRNVSEEWPVRLAKHVYCVQHCHYVCMSSGNSLWNIGTTLSSED